MTKQELINDLVESGKKIINDTKGHSRLTAALHAARDCKRLAELRQAATGADRKAISREYDLAIIRKHWHTGRLSEAGLERSLRDRAESALS